MEDDGRFGRFNFRCLVLGRFMMSIKHAQRLAGIL